MSLNEFIESGGAGVVLLVGDAPALVGDAFSQLKAWATEQCGPPEFNYCAYSASTGGVMDAVNSAMTPPMMADKRVVVVTELESASDAGFVAISRYLTAPCDSTIFIMTGGKLPTKRSQKGMSEDWSKVLVSQARTSGAYFLFDASSVSPANYAMQIARSFGGSLGRQTATELISVVGTEHARIREEVRKLVTYVGGNREVTREDISEAVSMMATIDVWGLTSGVASRNAGQALVALHRLHEQGDAPHRLIAMVTWQLRAIVSSLEALRRGATDQQAMKAGGIRSSQFSAIKARASEWQHDDLAATIAQLAATNLNMNSRRVGDRRELESLIITLCAR